MKIIITGGAGFIGSNLAGALLKEGHEIKIIDNLISGNIKLKNIEYVKLDILEKEKIEKETRGFDAVFHLAADPRVKESVESPDSSFKINVLGTFNVLEACRKNNIKKFVFTSSSTVYGRAKKIPTPESEPYFPISPYGASKASCDCYISAYSDSYGIDCASLIYANIFGDNSRHGVMYDFYNKLKKNPKKLEILGDGSQKKSYLYISGCINATILAFKKTKNYERYNIGSSESHTVNKIAEVMCKVMKLNPKIEYTGGKIGWIGDVHEFLLDTEKIRKLGWKENVSFEDGIKKYMGWLDKNLK